MKVEIERVLTISSAHISETTNNMLLEETDCGKNILSVYRKSEYGFWIYVPETELIDEYTDLIPKELLKCLNLARENECNWLCIDCDGAEVEGLETFDW